MKLDADVSVGAVCRAMGVAELDGALVKQLTVTVIYRRNDVDRMTTFRRRGGDRLIVSDAEVEPAAAIEAMPLGVLDMIGLGHEDGYPSHDDGDLHDFIAACMAGDRQGALALIPRLFDGANASTAEHLLLSERRFA